MMNKIQELSFEFMIKREIFLPKRISLKRINANIMKETVYALFFFIS